MTVDQYVDGPRTWSAWPRRTWLLTQPVSWLFWPISLFFIGVCAIVVLDVVPYYRGLWQGKKR